MLDVVGGRAASQSALPTVFSSFVSVFLNQWENGPPHLAAMSASLFVPNIRCAFTVSSWPPVPLVSALFWVLQDSLPSPLLPSPCLLVGHCSFSNLQAAPLRQPLTAPISLCGSRPALLHKRGWNSSSKQKTWKCNFATNTSHFWGFLLFLKTASKAALWASCVLGLHCCHWVWEDP